MKQPYLSVVIPVFNEEKRLNKCFIEIERYFSTKKYNYEVIFVNDGSKDNTRKNIEGKIKNRTNCKLLNNDVNYGKGYSVRRGVLEAQGRYILFTDTDFSTPLKNLDKLLPYIKEFFAVIGSRYLKNGSIKIKQPMVRRIISRTGNMLIKFVLGLAYVDTQCGFKLFEQNIAKDIFSRATINRWGFDIEILSIARIRGVSVKEVTVDWYDDPDSKLRAGRAAYNTLKELFRIRWNISTKKYN